MSLPTNTSSSEQQAQRLPKRLAALMAIYAITSGVGLWLDNKNLFCVLTLMMVLAVIGRQKAGLFMLRGYTVIQLALVCLLPVLLQMSDKLADMLTKLKLGGFEFNPESYLQLFILLMISGLQVWIAFTPKVRAYFNRKMNMNIMV